MKLRDYGVVRCTTDLAPDELGASDHDAQDDEHQHGKNEVAEKTGEMLGHEKPP